MSVDPAPGRARVPSDCVSQSQVRGGIGGQMSSGLPSLVPAELVAPRGGGMSCPQGESDPALEMEPPKAVSRVFPGGHERGDSLLDPVAGTVGGIELPAYPQARHVTGADVEQIVQRHRVETRLHRDAPAGTQIGVHGDHAPFVRVLLGSGDSRERIRHEKPGACSHDLDGEVAEDVRQHFSVLQPQLGRVMHPKVDQLVPVLAGHGVANRKQQMARTRVAGVPLGQPPMHCPSLLWLARRERLAKRVSNEAGEGELNVIALVMTLGQTGRLDEPDQDLRIMLLRKVADEPVRQPFRQRVTHDLREAALVLDAGKNDPAEVVPGPGE